MKMRTTERPGCDEEKAGNASSMFQMFKRGIARVIKFGLRYLLLRPETWRWMMVHVPAFVEKIEIAVKGGFTAVIEFFF